MKSLAESKCIPCRRGDPPLSDLEIKELANLLPDWQIVEKDGIPSLERVFKFKNFVQALEFTNKIGEIAEAADHHPALLTEWGKITVTWWTHAVKGLHRNDFIMAARTDRQFKK